MSPGQPGKFAQACFVGRASGDKERWKHGAAQGGEAAVQRVVRGSGAGTIGFLWGGYRALCHYTGVLALKLLLRERTDCCGKEPDL
ncbi:hypothetical protein NDU88_010841 [Pleurodeles waltl]|uniref:Uncharacterized protein n=1 Tax=Pleurodeles waltl TaxID=8319 RepID=A0AAV7S2A0_PLEWA|nr:hypothetical protein NDU88_010841 [Pleurodeles waltl]